jgi:hypothetical protein
VNDHILTGHDSGYPITSPLPLLATIGEAAKAANKMAARIASIENCFFIFSAPVPEILELPEPS